MTSGSLECDINELNLEYTLMSGQAFRWQRDAEDWWSCLLPLVTPEGIRENVLLRVRQNAHILFYKGSHPNTLAVLQDYFRLSVDLRALCAIFRAADPGLAVAIARFPGLRVLRQDPVENLFSFLCTPAAPLHRIRRSITGLCRAYGDGKVQAGGRIYDPFPTLDALAKADVSDMKTLGLGYRARFVQAAARALLLAGGEPQLRDLRAASYPEAKTALRTLPGVGEKIADCVCLFSLDKDAAIPVDTHVRRIAGRDYGIGAEARSLTPAVSAQIGDALRARFGPMAGWAQQFLFFHELYGKGAWDTYQAMHHGNQNRPSA